MLASITHILPLTNIRRTRVLAVPGKVLVRVGQKVNASDVIAQAQKSAGHTILDIRRGLGVTRISEAERCIVRQQGDRLEKGDVIAEASGLFSRIVRAPSAGEIVSISGGQVLLRTETTQVEVLAGFNGIVFEIIPELGAVIEVNGGLVQGVWGNGRMDNGLLLVIAAAPDDQLTGQKIDVSMRGAVVMGGHCSSADVLRAAGDLPLRGLILSSITADLIPVARSQNYPILVTDGFGKIPMNEPAFKLLTTSEKRDVSIHAVYNPGVGERPELIIPLPAAGQLAPETDYFAQGQLVRIQGMPYTGKVGTIVQLHQGLFTLPNGLKVSAADVQLESDMRVSVPLTNLEVIE
ncbi:MAG: hypothetical protein IH586_13180 [Anaerolineaceae bacterium]|nr:hypothetical protein [Anaerolineaceae bacterium]